MEYFNNKSIKVLIFMVVCCLLFVIFLPLSYRNVSTNDRQTVNSANIASDETEMQKNDSEENSAEENSEYSEQDSYSDETAESPEQPQRTDFSKNLEEIEELPQAAKPQVKDDVFAKANDLRAEEKYESAVYEYEQLAKNSDNAEFKAKCYEEIALTYASMKRFGSGLSYAQKAFNTAPSTERELLLARMYYKTGSADKAQERVNAILKRDFN